MVSKLLIFDEKAKTFRLFENDSFDQLKSEIIQFNLNLKSKSKQKKRKASRILQSHPQSV